MRTDRPLHHFRLEALASGVYGAIATVKGHGLCNAGIIDLGGRTVVFDSMLTPMAGAALARAAERCTGRKPDWVVNSHWHGDHIWGNSAFSGSRVVSSRKVREVVLRKSRAQYEECRREFPQELATIAARGSPIAPHDRSRVRAWYEGVLRIPRLRIVPPGLTFDEELVLEGSRRALHLITYGGGHSPSDVFGFLPEERILFAGDLVMVGLHPSVGDGWPDSWARILRRIQRLRPERVLPGHGPVAPNASLRTVAQYLIDLQRIGLRGVARGQSVEQVRETPIPERYRNWGFAFMFSENVARAFELETARPPPPRERMGSRGPQER